MSTSLLTQFQNDGYLILEKFNSAKSCDDLMHRAEELVRNYNIQDHPSIFQTSNQSASTDDYFLRSGNEISFFFEKDAFDKNGKLIGDTFHSLNKIGHALHDLDPLFNSFSRSPQMTKIASDLEMDEYVIIQSMMIFKHAKIGGVVDVHQDSTFLYTEPDSCIGFWFALEDATVNNGCLWAKPGGHQTNLRTRFRRKEGGGTEMQILDEEHISLEGMIPLEVKKGDCIVLHGLLPHFSKPNTSGISRQAYSIHTIRKGTNYPMDNWLRRDMNSLRGFTI
ncbi:MAG TPA: phytanoyl-CoA dioxygenase family protein [Bacteroidia bacterium]|nr:phytanoyl-CoA dioxygenase family protein [Bacteroidia bacterium]